jgi:PAS domain-containing protein
VGGLGNELHDAWPVFVSIAIIVGAIQRWGKPGIAKVVREEVLAISAYQAEELKDKLLAVTAEQDRGRNDLVANLKNHLDEISEEFSPNGGSSLKDQVTRIEKSVVHLAENNNFSTARILALQANKDLALYEMNAEGHLVHINSAFVNLYQRPYEELMAGGWVDHIDPKDIDRIAESGRAATEGRTTWFERFTVIRQDGTRVPCVGRGYPIVSLDGDFYGFAGAISIDDDIVRHTSSSPSI